MSYKFKYHPDGWIGINGEYHKSFQEFKSNNPNFPLYEGDYMEIKEDNSAEIIVKFNGTYIGFPRSIDSFAPILQAINNLGD